MDFLQEILKSAEIVSAQPVASSDIIVAGIITGIANTQGITTYTVNHGGANYSGVTATSQYKIGQSVFIFAEGGLSGKQKCIIGLATSSTLEETEKNWQDWNSNVLTTISDVNGISIKGGEPSRTTVLFNMKDPANNKLNVNNTQIIAVTEIDKRLKIAAEIKLDNKEPANKQGYLPSSFKLIDNTSFNYGVKVWISFINESKQLEEKCFALDVNQMNNYPYYYPESTLQEAVFELTDEEIKMINRVERIEYFYEGYNGKDSGHIQITNLTIGAQVMPESVPKPILILSTDASTLNENTPSCTIEAAIVVSGIIANTLTIKWEVEEHGEWVDIGVNDWVLQLDRKSVRRAVVTYRATCSFNYEDGSVGSVSETVMIFNKDSRFLFTLDSIEQAEQYLVEIKRMTDVWEEDDNVQASYKWIGANGIIPSETKNFSGDGIIDETSICYKASMPFLDKLSNIHVYAYVDGYYIGEVVIKGEDDFTIEEYITIEETEYYFVSDKPFPQSGVTNTNGEGQLILAKACVKREGFEEDKYEVVEKESGERVTDQTWYKKDLSEGDFEWPKYMTVQDEVHGWMEKKVYKWTRKRIQSWKKSDLGVEGREPQSDYYTTPTIAEADRAIVDWCMEDDTTTINGASIYTGTVNTDQLNANAIHSLSYPLSETDYYMKNFDNFPTNGSFFDLNTGNLFTPIFKSYINTENKPVGAFKGYLVANDGGQIAGWNIDGNSITKYGGNKEEYSNSFCMKNPENNSSETVLAIGNCSQDDWSQADFRVTSDGGMYSTSGEIGGWQLSKTQFGTEYRDEENKYEVFMRSVVHDYGVYYTTCFEVQKNDDPVFFIRPTGELVSQGDQSKTSLNNGEIVVEYPDVGGTKITPGIINLYWASEREDPTAKISCIYDSNDGQTKGELFGRWKAKGFELNPNSNSDFMVLKYGTNETARIMRSIDINHYGAFMIFNNHAIVLSTSRGYLYGTWYLGTSSVITSDENRKHDIELLDSRYDVFFDNLTSYRFKYNDGTSDRYHTGYTTQNTQSALKTAEISEQEFAGICTMNRGTEAEYSGLRYEEFISLNTWQIQKLKNRVAELEAKMSDLKAHLANQ